MGSYIFAQALGLKVLRKVDKPESKVNFFLLLS